MEVEAISRENLLQNIQNRLNNLEKKVNDQLEKENLQLSLKGVILINLEYPIFSKTNNSILKKVLTHDLWKRYYKARTNEGFTINDIIQGGIDNEDHKIGIVAASADCYVIFHEIFIEVANFYHKREFKQNKFENESYSMLKNFIMNMDDLLDNHLIEFEIHTKRNISDYAFSPKISRGNRKELANLIKETITKFEKDVKCNFS